MPRKLSKRSVIGGVAIGALVAAGATYAANQPSPKEESQAFLKSAADRLDVSSNELENALEGAYSDRLDAAVKAGRLTKSQADELKKRAQRDGGVPFFGGPGPRGLHGPHGPGGHRHAGPTAAAKYLGLSESALHQQIESGKTLAEVAKARGKSVDGLKDAMKDAIRADLDKAVKADRLTETMRKQMLADLDQRIDAIVNGKGPRGPGGPGRGGPGGFDGPGGPGGRGGFQGPPL
jgi:hypothetical protein